jgi:sugar porter (SP) family MFS transporter
MTPFIDKYGDHVTDGVISFSPSLLAVLSSIIQAGELVGSIASGWVGFYFGRKGGLLSASLIAIVGVILQAAAPNPGALIAGRVILGIAVGLLSNSVPLYLSEITPKQIRGIVVGSWQLILCTAGLIGSGINQGTQNYAGQASYQIPICFQLICPLAILTFIWFVPESPRFLVSKDRLDEARVALCKINRSNKEYDPTLQINEFILQEEAERAGPQGSWFELITDPIEGRKTLLCAGTFAAQQLTGNTFIVSYCIVFTQDLQVANPFAIGEILNALAIFAVILSWIYIERFDRRTILIGTTSFMVLLMLVIGGLACGPEKSFLVPVAPIGKAIIGLTLIFLFCFNLGWGPLAWTVATEICVGRNRSRIMAVSTSAFWFFSWLVTFTLPYLFTTARIGAKVGFVYAGSSTISLLFVLLLLPETQGRSLEEIEEMFIDKIPSRKWKDYRTRITTAALGILEEKRAAVNITNTEVTETVEGSEKTEK